jgi:hypothetical protein
MTQRDVEIGNYQLILYPKVVSIGLITGLTLSECHGYVSLYSKTTSDYYYLLIAPNNIASLPEPRTYNYGTYMFGSSVIKYENLHTLLDILRNEKPIFMRIDDTRPTNNLIYTGREPVGEGMDVSP